MLKIILNALFSLFFFSGAAAQVHTGLDNLIAGQFKELEGKKIGLICNQTSLTSKGEFSPKILSKKHAFKLKALFTPEHGLMGERKAGVTSDTAETFEGIPVYSLYGDSRKPSRPMLRGIDALVFDIQDIGLRPYTYLSTMIYAMEAAAEYQLEFIVLDRPNPLSGERIEGNILDTSLRSFLGVIPIPYLHGMTLGELAKMAKDKKWFVDAESLELTVVPMTGWKRSMYWNETGLKWKAPSPNIPTFASAVGCAMFGAAGELGIISVGVGSDLPFLRLGSKLVQPDFFEQCVRASLPKGISAKREDFTVPFEDTTKTFQGLKIELPKNLGAIEKMYGPEYLILKKLSEDTVFAEHFDSLGLGKRKVFEKVTGLHNFLMAFNSIVEVTTTVNGEKKNISLVEGFVNKWQRDADKFREMRKKYLLYE
jgi:uncharacterized protein YbbC (DUF1343 family)